MSGRTARAADFEFGPDARELRAEATVMTFKEIAEEMQLPEPTVTCIFYRAMKKLSKDERLKELRKLSASKEYVDLNA